MITSKQAQARIKRWDGRFRQTIMKRIDGPSFIKTDLILHDGKSESVIDSFIHPPITGRPVKNRRKNK